MRQAAGSRGHREATREVLSCTPSCERVARKARKNAKKEKKKWFISPKARKHTSSTIINIAVSPMKQWPSLKMLFSRQMVYIPGISLGESSSKIEREEQLRYRDGYQVVISLPEKRAEKDKKSQGSRNFVQGINFL